MPISSKKTKGRKVRGARRSSSATKAARRVVIDFPFPLYDATEIAAAELATNRSALIRDAVKHFLEEIHRQKMEKALIEGYAANAAAALTVANEMMGAEADFI